MHTEGHVPIGDSIFEDISSVLNVFPRVLVNNIHQVVQQRLAEIGHVNDVLRDRPVDLNFFGSWFVEILDCIFTFIRELLHSNA